MHIQLVKHQISVDDHRGMRLKCVLVLNLCTRKGREGNIRQEHGQNRRRVPAAL